MKSGIYKITNIINQKVYIGQSINVEYRLRKHKEMLKSNRHCNQHLQASFNQYGEGAFLFEKIDTCPVDELDERERMYILFCNSTSRDYGYNIQDGGNAKHGCPEETKNKISLKNKGRKLNPFTDEHKHKISESNKGRIINPLSIEKAIKTRADNKSLWGEKNGNAIITDCEAERIVLVLCLGKSVNEIASEMNVSKNIVYNIQQNRSYVHIRPELRVKAKESVREMQNEKISNALTLYRTGLFSQNEIAKTLHISRNTLRREIARCL